MSEHTSNRPFDRQLSLTLDRLILRLEEWPHDLRRATLKRQKSQLERRIPLSKVRYARR
jgi:hypothetical protein